MRCGALYLKVTCVAAASLNPSCSTDNPHTTSTEARMWRNQVEFQRCLRESHDTFGVWCSGSPWQILNRVWHWQVFMNETTNAHTANECCASIAVCA